MSKTDITTKKHIRSSFRDAVYTNLNIGMTESYFAAFMLALGLSEVAAGLGTIIPQFVGVFFLLISIRSFFTKYSLKNRIMLFLGIQALTMIPLIFVGLYQVKSPILILAILSFYWANLLSLNPPWNRLVGHTIPVKFRLKFFSIRNQFGQFSIFLGLITTGILLYFGKKENLEMKVFVGLFIIGFILKLLSLWEFKSFHQDYALPPGSEKKLEFKTFLRRLPGTELGTLILFLMLFYISVHLSAPYFNPFMLSKLNFSYLQFMAITSISYFGRVIILRILQKRARARHVNTILLFSTLAISLTPLLWTFSQNFWWILAIEFFSGCYWAGFELSTVLMYFQKIDDIERTSVTTYITFLNTTSMVVGSLLGALIMKILPEGKDSFLILFGVSSLLRLVLVIFAPQLNFRGSIPKLLSFNRVMSVRPPFGGFSRPFIGKIKDEEKE